MSEIRFSCMAIRPEAVVGWAVAMMLSGSLMGTAGAEGPAQGDEPVWTVRMVQNEREDRLAVESRLLFVDLLEQHAWTIRNIRYGGDEIVGEHGANGSVVNARPEANADSDDPWIGTGHGKEKVQRLTILVDGEEVFCRSGTVLSGRTVAIRKLSNLGPLDHEAELVFPASGDRIVERHAYQVVEDLDQRFHFVYAFMHCNNNALDRWMALTGKGKELEGRVGKADGQFSLKEDIQAVGFYSPALKKGVVYAYPEVYRGAAHFKNSIWDRKGDNKLYFRPEIGNTDRVGARFEFRLQVIPFSAAPDDWKRMTRTLAEQG